MKLTYERPYAQVLMVANTAIMTESTDPDHDNGYIDWGELTNDNIIPDIKAP